MNGQRRPPEPSDRGQRRGDERQGKPDGAPQTPGPRIPGWIRVVLGLGLAAAVVWWIVSNPVAVDERDELAYTQFVSEVQDGNVETVQVTADGAVTGTRTDESTFRTQIPTALATEELTQLLAEQGVEIEATGTSTSFWGVLIALLPLVVFVGLLFFLGRSATRGVGALGGVGKSKAKVIDSQRPSTTFEDVAGYDGVKREVREVVEFLRNPERYQRAGAIGPRGVLMLGPPGTGKTLMARAIAGEASVPFLTVTGSAFVEMFVGVGAARVRDLFEQARGMAPAIIFIDEIDTVGGRRGGAGGVMANDEREQTLNQLLAEMDGFDPAEGIVVLAATNRPDVLDPALLRPGRFDRQVVIPLPNQEERLAILHVHCRGKRLDPDVDLNAVARGTPGFSGADLANLTNEAAIFAVRDERTVVTAHDFDDARDRILLGRREGSNVLLPEEKVRVAVHESGHALVAALHDDADPVAKVTILPAGQALGATEQLPLGERHLFSESWLATQLAVRLGGRAAELVVFGEGSSGAADDLTGATRLAGHMVREFGFSDRLGPVGYGTTSPMFLGRDEVTIREYSEATQHAIDEEIAGLLRAAEAEAVQCLEGQREALDQLTDLLMDEETVSGDAVYDLVGREKPEGPVAMRHAEEIAPTAGPAPQPPESGPEPDAPVELR